MANHIVHVLVAVLQQRYKLTIHADAQMDTISIIQEFVECASLAVLLVAAQIGINVLHAETILIEWLMDLVLAEADSSLINLMETVKQ